MEIPHLHSDDVESLSDTTKKKEKKAKKAAPFIHVPVPVQIEAAKNVPPEAQRAMAELGDDDKTKKRKKAKKKVGHTLLSDKEEIEQPAVDAARVENTPERQSAEDHEDTEDHEADEEDDDTEAEAEIKEIEEIGGEKSPKPESNKKPKDQEFLGELLISDRARRLYELEEAQRAEIAAELEAEVSEEVDDRALLEQLAEEIAELDEEALDPQTTTEDEPDDTTTQPVGASRGTSSSSSTLPVPTPISTTSSTTPPANPTPPVPAAVGGSGGALPPVPVMTASASPNMQPAAPNIAPTPASMPQVEAMPNRRAERRGLLTGLLVGGVIEHVRHKRRERKMDKEHSKQIKNLSAEQQAVAIQTAEKEKASSRKQTALESQLSRLKAQVSRITPEQSTIAEPITPERSFNNPLDRFLSVPTSEKPAAKISEKPTLKSKEKSPEEIAKERAVLEQTWAAEQESFEKQREVPNDRRVETSSWHSIEVDKKTGKAVEDPTITYGEEFKYEQHQEQLRRDVEDASIESASMRERYVEPHMRLPSEQIAPIIPASSQAQTSLTNKKPATNQDEDDDSGIQVVDIILWGILAVVVVIIFRVLAG